MAKYLFQAKYTLDGLKGLQREGGSSRKAVIEGSVSGLGGTLECMYWAFGETDVFVVADLPSNTSAAAFVGNVSAAGGATVTTTVLLTAEEIDAAIGTSVDYRAPGA
jgi:uncharacterized protein with GYD domain